MFRLTNLIRDKKASTFFKSIATFVLFVFLYLPTTVQAQYTIGSPSTATATIVDDEATLAIADASAQDEGDMAADATTFTFTVTRTGYLGATVEVDYMVMAGDNVDAAFNAGADDFEGGSFPSGTITFNATETTQDIMIAIEEDMVGEENEDFKVVLSNVNVTMGTGTVTITDDTGMSTINNDDNASVSIVVAPSSVVEDAGSSLIYTFTRTRPYSGAITVNFSISGDIMSDDFDVSMTVGVNYDNNGTIPQAGTIVIADGMETNTLTVVPTTDSNIEGDEDITVTITPFIP